MTTVTATLQVRRIKKGRKRLARRDQIDHNVEPAGRVPRIARLMALAIKFQGMLRDGIVQDRSELARLAQVTQPRMSQIMNLTFLSPEIQEKILSLIAPDEVLISEKLIRPITAEPRWEKQSRMLQDLLQPSA